LSLWAGERGGGALFVLLDVKVGDRVLFAKYAGTEIKQDGTKYLIMRESDILAILD